MPPVPALSRRDEVFANDDILELILRHVRRPRPAVATMHRWRDLHQQDLTICMRVSTRFHFIAAPLLYRTPVVDDLALFLVGITPSQDAGGRKKKNNMGRPALDTASTRRRRSKLECLALTRRLFLEIPDAWEKLPKVTNYIVWPDAWPAPKLATSARDMHTRLAKDKVFNTRRRALFGHPEGLLNLDTVFANLETVILDAYFHHSTLGLLYYDWNVLPEHEFSTGPSWVGLARSEVCLMERHGFLSRISRPDLHVCHHMPYNIRPDPDSPSLRSGAIHLHYEPLWTDADTEERLEYSKPPFVPDIVNIIRLHPLGSPRINSRARPPRTGDGPCASWIGWPNVATATMEVATGIRLLLRRVTQPDLDPEFPATRPPTLRLVVPPLPPGSAEIGPAGAETTLLDGFADPEAYARQWRIMANKIDNQFAGHGIRFEAVIEQSSCPACQDDYDIRDDAMDAYEREMCIEEWQYLARSLF